jgi:hypothetical protein
MINRKECGRKRPWTTFKVIPGMCLEELRKTTKNLSQYSQSQGRDLNPGPSVYGARLPFLSLKNAVLFLNKYVRIVIMTLSKQNQI